MKSFERSFLLPLSCWLRTLHTRSSRVCSVACSAINLAARIVAIQGKASSGIDVLSAGYAHLLASGHLQR